MISDTTRTALAAAIEKTPKWLRSDLTSTDPSLRQRAEDSLLAIVLSAIDERDAVAKKAEPE